MSNDQALAELLQRFRSDLTEICGEDLADSLLKAGQSGGVPNLDMQLVINDGLEMMDDTQRTQILALLDDFMAQAKTLKSEP